MLLLIGALAAGVVSHCVLIGWQGPQGEVAAESTSGWLLLWELGGRRLASSAWSGSPSQAKFDSTHCAVDVQLVVTPPSAARDHNPSVQQFLVHVVPLIVLPPPPPPPPFIIIIITTTTTTHETERERERPFYARTSVKERSLAHQQTQPRPKLSQSQPAPASQPAQQRD